MITKYRYLFQAPFDVMARFFAALGFTPNGLTIFGLLLGCSVCALFIWNQNAVLFGWLIISCGLIDVVDGALARLTNQASKFGSYLDAMCDRLFEMAALLAIGWVSGHWLSVFVLLGGSFLTSYAKARAAMEVSISNTEWPDIAERGERCFIVAFGAIFWGSFPNAAYLGRDIMFWVIVGTSVLVYGSVTQRIFRAKKYIEARA